MELYKCSKGFKYSAWVAICTSTIPSVVKVNPESDEDLLIMETSTPDLNLIVTLKSTAENGKFKFFPVSPYIKDFAKKKEGTIEKQKYLVYFSKKTYEAYLKNKEMNIGTPELPIVNRYFADSSYKSEIVSKNVRKIIITGQHLKVPQTFNVVCHRMYLPYLEHVTIDDLVEEKTAMYTKVYSKKIPSLKFYYYCVFPLPSHTELIISFNKNVYCIPQCEFMKLITEPTASIKDATSIITIPISGLANYMIVPF